MKKTITAFISLTLFALAAHAQSLSDLERVQRRAQMAIPCEELAKAGGRDDACKDIVTPKVQELQEAFSGAGKVKAKPEAASLIEITGYRSGLIGGTHIREVEVLLDGQFFRMSVGDTAAGWKLVRLTHLEAEFKTAKSRSAAPKVISFRSPSTPAPEHVMTPGLSTHSPSQMLNPPVPTSFSNPTPNNGPLAPAVPVPSQPRLN